MLRLCVRSVRNRLLAACSGVSHHVSSIPSFLNAGRYSIAKILTQQRQKSPLEQRMGQLRHCPGPASSRNLGTSSPFPAEGWSPQASLLPVVSATTVLDHLMKTGKSLSGDEFTVVQKPLNRGHQFLSENMYTMCSSVAQTQTVTSVKCSSNRSVGHLRKKARNTHKK